MTRRALQREHQTNTERRRQGTHDPSTCPGNHLRGTKVVAHWQVPHPVDREEIARERPLSGSALLSRRDALAVVLDQELDRYAALLNQVRRSCADLCSALKGTAAMSSDLADLASTLALGQACEGSMDARLWKHPTNPHGLAVADVAVPVHSEESLLALPLFNLGASL